MKYCHYLLFLLLSSSVKFHNVYAGQLLIKTYTKNKKFAKKNKKFVLTISETTKIRSLLYKASPRLSVSSCWLFIYILLPMKRHDLD